MQIKVNITCHILVVLISLGICNKLYSEAIFIKENFHSLSDWKELYFPNIEKHSKYSILKRNGSYMLKTESNGSASGIIHKNVFNVYQFLIIEWEWKIEQVYKNTNIERKEGDDYPIRVLVLFQFEEKNANLFEQARFEFLKTIYGQFPPHNSLNYVWASGGARNRTFQSPYTNRAIMIVLRSGMQYGKEWHMEKANVLEDYRNIFRENPPENASIAIMNDGDNTGESSTSYLKWIKVSDR